MLDHEGIMLTLEASVALTPICTASFLFGFELFKEVWENKGTVVSIVKLTVALLPVLVPSERLTFSM